ncbi:hypothetical protein BDZ89DRAFT_973841 [Hymenopellis radicata]|nr:hypothetical protein BDZ89DRAFT_973841 [Hymenopellis radicata]
MIPWLLLLPLPVARAAEVVGVPPSLQASYAPSASGSWKCLDGSKEIPWKFVNDDSCDCPDGSDEPGTGACPNTYFYCRNEGHTGANIPSSRVRDGLCEPECCDGSDERPGVCENICVEVGKEYRKKRAEELKIQKTGAKIRSTYVAFAEKEKKRLEGVIQTSSQEITVREKEVARLQDIADRTESLSAAELEYKKESPLYQSLLEHRDALKSLQREHKKHLEREKTLSEILDALRTGYNPNYQDMAVLDAVRGWEYLAGLPHINDVGKDASAETEDDEETDSEPEEVIPEGEWTPVQLEKDLPKLLKTDYVSLLLEHDEHVSTPAEGSMLFELSNYLPDALIPQYEDFKDTLLGWMETIGVIRPSVGVSTGRCKATHAQQALNDAKNSLRKVEKEKQTAEEDLQKISDSITFGPQGEWKKLDGTCLEKDVGDYTYEVCLFGASKQKPKKGGTTFNLGKFSSWNPDAEPGTPEYYEKQMYTKGTKCWNGPERSLLLVMTCGTENVIHTVAELEKCQYQFTGTSPALCLPVSETNGGAQREEL